MKTQTDHELLRDFAERQSDDAFSTLLNRYVDLVCSTARRMLGDGDRHLAEDVAQEVFKSLSDKAIRLGERPLDRWLHAATYLAVIQRGRTEARRRAREQKAAAMNPLMTEESDDTWKEVAPHLDAALVELPEDDHEAVILRFFHSKTFQEIGLALGVSDETAHRRVSRGIERLRELLAERGVTVGTSALGVAIAANAVQAAPAGLAASIAAALGLSGGVSAAVTATVAIGSVSTAATAATATTNTIAMTALKAIVAASLAGLLGVSLFEVRRANGRRAAAEAAAQQQASLVEQLELREEALNRQAASQGEVIRGLLVDRAELLRLRGEVGQLRAAVANGAAAQDPEMSSWLDRKQRLRARLEQTLEAQVPELRLATRQDWLEASRETLETDMDYRKALSTLRHAAESKLAAPFHAALTKYLEATSGQFPATVQPLASYFEPPVDPALLARWKVERAMEEDTLKMGGQFIITQTPVDEALDQLWVLGPGGYGSSHMTLKDKRAQILASVGEAFRASGQALRDPAQLQVFATTAEQRAVVDELVTRFKSMSAEEQAQALRPLQPGR